MVGSILARLARACAASALALTVLATVPAAALERAAAGRATLRAGPAGPPTYLAPEPPPAGAARRAAAAASFSVSYNGFTPAARAAFQRAVDIWAQKLSSPVTITVSASFQPLGAGILGSAGPGLFWRGVPGAPFQDTWYVDALANRFAGRQLDDSPDIMARFNSNFSSWHFGSGPAPAGKYDFTTVVLHELGHGLGFLGAGDVSGGVGTVRLGAFPIIYDRFTENRNDRSLLEDFPDRSSALAAQLTGGNVFFDSPRVRSANGGVRARLYAPSVFDDGSSYSHLDEATFRRGNRNALMTPFLGAAETVRRPGPVTLAILDTLGW